MKVSRAAAVFFRDQCIGFHNGQMARIPNTPVLLSLVDSHSELEYLENDTSRNEHFVSFLESVVEQLKLRNED